MTLTNKHDKKIQVWKKTWIRGIVAVKRSNKRKMGELRVEVGLKERFKKELVRNRLK